MTNLWSFLLQTLSVTLAGALVLAVKALLKDKLTPRWQYFVWSVLALRLWLPVQTRGNYVLLPLPVWVETCKNWVEGKLSSAYTSFYQAVDVTAPIPWLKGLPVSVTDWLFVLYVLGVVLVLARYLISYGWLRGLLRRGAPASPALRARVSSVGARYGLSSCDVVVLSNLPSPMVCGVFRPVLALPRDEAPDDHVLLHELLHIKYFDALQNVFWCLCRALHWCNPAVQLLLNRVGNDLESLCDQRVLERLEGEARRSYGVSLLAMANDRYPRAPGTTSISNGGKNIARRIEAIVRFRSYPKGMALASVCVTALLLGACLLGTVEPELAYTSSSLGTVEERIATGRLTRCTTVAGALDTYAKGILKGNDMYLMMASPLEQRKALEDRIRETGQVLYFDTGKEEVMVYSVSDPYNAPTEGRRKAVEYCLSQDEYYVYNLEAQADGSYHAFLVFLTTQHSESAGIGQDVLGYPVKVEWENGYVVEPLGEKRLYLLSSEEYSYTFYAPSSVPFLPAKTQYYAEGESGAVRVDEYSRHEVENTVETEGHWPFGMGGHLFDAVPKPDAEFEFEQESCVTRYRFGGSEEARQALYTLGVESMPLTQDAPPADSAAFEAMSGNASNSYWAGSEFGGSSNRGFWRYLEIGDSWDGTVTDNGSGNPFHPENPCTGFAVRILWNGEEQEILTLKEVADREP